MTLEIVVNWLAEYAMRYGMDSILLILQDAFPNIVPCRLKFPNKPYLMTVEIINSLIRFRDKKVQNNISIKKKLQKCEFWRRFRSLLMGIMADKKCSYNLLSFESFIAQINVLEYVIDTRTQDGIELNSRVDEMMNDSCAIRYNETSENMEDLKYLSVMKIREHVSNDIDLKIKKLLKDGFVNSLKISIENKILAKTALGLIRFFHCVDDHKHTTDPFIRILRNSMIKLKHKNSEYFRFQYFSPAELINIIECLKQEDEMQNLPSDPIVVYLKDEETKGITGLKVKITSVL